MGFYYDFENADAFATGAIGTPGERTFYMQEHAEVAHDARLDTVCN